MGELILRSIPSLLVIFGLAGGWWWLRRWQRGTGTGLRVVSRVALLRGATIAVVEMGGRAWLIGATERNIEVLAEIDEATLGTEAEPPVNPISGSGPWTDLFNRALKATGIERPSTGPGHDL